MLANIVSPPDGGSSRMCRMLPIGGSTSQETSVCQRLPATAFEFASALTTRTSGCLERTARSDGCAACRTAAERLLLLEVDVLVAEEDHEMAQQGVVDLLERLVAERAGEIDAADLGTDHGAQRLDLDRLVLHGHVLLRLRPQPPRGRRESAC